MIIGNEVSARGWTMNETAELKALARKPGVDLFGVCTWQKQC
jgi:hypothetical protein